METARRERLIYKDLIEMANRHERNASTMHCYEKDNDACERVIGDYRATISPVCNDIRR